MHKVLVNVPFLTILAIEMPHYSSIFSGSKIGGLPTGLNGSPVVLTSTNVLENLGKIVEFMIASRRMG